MNQEFYNAVKESVQMSQQRWVEWRHEMTGLLHCGSCLSLHKCWFVFEKAPVSPLHEKCHCTTVAIPVSQVKNNAVANSVYSKYNPYLFDPKNFYKHGKNKAFESWGYTVSDSEWLQKEIEKQGRQQYLLGNYELGALNMRGQRISIRVTIPRKNGTGEVSFVTGWMVKPGGEIKLNTPYGGK